MSLLPIKGGWRSERTVTSVQNGMLYYITRAKIEWLSSRFADLKHKLNDHVEDWEKMQALSKGHGYELFCSSKSPLLAVPCRITRSAPLTHLHHAASHHAVIGVLLGLRLSGKKMAPRTAIHNQTRAQATSQAVRLQHNAVRN